jgi:hypothetical protein
VETAARAGKAAKKGFLIEFPAGSPPPDWRYPTREFG